MPVMSVQPVQCFVTWTKQHGNQELWIPNKLWNFSSHVLSLPGTFVPGSENDKELSLPLHAGIL